MSDVIFDEVLNKLRTQDEGSGGGGGGGTVTGINSFVSGGSAKITVTGGDGEVKFVGVGGTTITSSGGLIQLNTDLSGVQPKISSGATLDINVTGNAATATNATSATSAGTAGAVTTAVSSAIISAAVSSAGSSLDVASVSEVMSGVQGGTQKVVDVSALRGGLTAGQAVDVTSQPDDVGANYREEIVWTSQSLGFTSFPKFAPGLKYLLIADLTYSASLGSDSGSVTPYGGTWLDGTTSPITLDDGVKTRVALLFDRASVSLDFVYADPIDQVIVSNLREYEVTSCTPEAIAYIAALTNPDEFQDYYLVKRDQVSPWTYIINMGASPATTVAAGLAYQINCTTGSHIITVDTCPEGFVGRDTFVRLLVGQTGNVVVQSPLKLATALTANAINNCEVKYRDGEAILTVVDTLGGYIVADVTGTTDGSLYYGLTTSGSYPYVTFSPVTNQSACDIGGATVSAQKIIVGNGVGSTIISGNLTISAGAAVTISNLSFANATLRGSASLIDVGVEPGTSAGIAGATVSITGGTVEGQIVASGSSGTVSIEPGAVVSFAGNGSLNTNSGTLTMSSGAIVAVENGSIDTGSGTNLVLPIGVQTVQYGMESMTISHTAAISAAAITSGCSLVYSAATLVLTSSTVVEGGAVFMTGVAGGRYIVIYNTGTVLTLRDTAVNARISIAVTPNNVRSYGTLILGGTIFAQDTRLFIDANSQVKGVVRIEDNTTIDITPMGTSFDVCQPVETLVIGSNCSIVSSGTTIPLSSGTYTSKGIAHDGTIS